MTSSPIELSDTEQQLLDIAKRIAQDSPDRSRKVGAVMVGVDGQIISHGCNTLPEGVPHTDQFLQRPAKYDWTEHAERNAIYKAAREGVKTQGCTMVLPWFPCIDCARAMVQAGVKRVIAQYPDINDPTWGPGFKVGLELFQRAGVQFDAFEGEAAPQAVAEGEHVTASTQEGPTAEELIMHFNETQIVPSPRPRAMR